MEETTLSFFKGKGFTEREIHRLSAKNPEFINELVKIDTFSHVTDIKTFLKNMDTLKSQPFEKQLYGEALSDVYMARKKFVEASGASAEKDAMHDFAAWSVFQANPTSTYLTANKLHYFCMKWGIDKAEFFKHTAKLPNTLMYTYREIRGNELAIQDMLGKAQCQGYVARDSPILDNIQNGALKGILGKPFCALRGGAGVGKTVCVSEIIKQVMQVTPVIAVAYTNKAKRCIAKKMEEFGIEGPNVIVSTIHSLIMHLKATQYKNAFIIVDEASMVDIETLGEMAKMIMKNIGSYQMCFVGDDFQLSPVGRGEFFRQLVATPQNSYALTKCYRAKDQDLFEAFEMIRNGIMPQSSENFKVIYVNDDKELNSQMGHFIRSHSNSFQYVAWQNKDVFKLNKWVQEALLKAGKLGLGEWRGYRENDVVCYRGEKKDNLTNALIGKVTEVHSDGMLVVWENGDKTLFKLETPEVQLFYVATVHLLQGSEFQNIVVPCYDIKAMMNLLDRRWLYTACTRAKHKVVILATKDVEAFVKKSVFSIQASGIQL